MKRPNDTKWLSRNVIVNGENRGLSTVTIGPDNHITVRPFVKEEEGVRYTDKAIRIDDVDGNLNITFV